MDDTYFFMFNTCFGKVDQCVETESAFGLKSTRVYFSGRFQLCKNPVGVSHLLTFSLIIVLKKKSKHILTGWLPHIDVNLVPASMLIRNLKIDAEHILDFLSSTEPLFYIHSVPLLRWVSRLHSRPGSKITCSHSCLWKQHAIVCSDLQGNGN